MKKMFVLMAAMALLLSGCSAKSPELDINQLAGSLMEGVEFQDELSIVEADTAKMLYGIENFTEARVFIGSGATAEEIALFSFENPEDAKAAVEKAEQRLAEQREDFASYIPEEVKRLDNAVVKQAGNYLAVCVSGGGEAKEIISEYMN